MKGWPQYRSSVLLAVFSSLLAVLCIVLLEGAGTSVSWLPAGETVTSSAAAASVDVEARPPLQAYSATWQAPLFNPSRQPDKVAQSPTVDTFVPTLDGLSVTGIVLTPTVRTVLLKQADGTALKINEGQQLANGWLVEQVESRRVTFSHGSTKQVLVLPTSKPNNKPGF